MPKKDEVVKPDEVKPEADPSEEPEFKTPEDEAFEEVQAEVKAAEDEAAKTGDDPPKKPDDVEDEENKKVAADAEPTPGAVEPVKGQDDPKAGEGEGDKRMVPIAALHESRGNLRDSELARARLEGMLAASQQQVERGGTPTPGQPAQPQQTLEAQVDALNAQVDALWAKGDEGELSLVEIRKQERVIEAQIRTIQGSPGGTVQPQGQQPPQLDATIEQNLVRLETDYPVITALNEVTMSQFVKQAYESAQAEGKPIGDGALETMRLHNLAAKHAHDHYAKFYAQTTAPVAPATPQPQVPAETPGGGLSEAAQARAAKMDLAAQHPPNINNLGTSADGQMSDEQISSKMEGMSEDEAIEFLDTMPGLAKRLGVTMPGPT